MDVAQIRENLYILHRAKTLRGKHTRLIVDSGAFSCWSAGKKITREKILTLYRQLTPFLEGKVDEFYFVNLDVIPAKRGEIPTKIQIEESAMMGWENFLYFQKHGIPTIPVFHQHERAYWLEKMKAECGGYMGLSPANDLHENRRVEWVKRQFGIVRDEVRCHGFATTGKEMLMAGPWYSVDSVQWMTPMLFGTVQGKQAQKKTKELQSRTAGHMKRALRVQLEETSLRLERRATDYWRKHGIDWDKRDAEEHFWKNWRRRHFEGEAESLELQSDERVDAHPGDSIHH